MTTADPLIAVAQRGYEAWNRGDLGWFLDNMTEDIEIRPPTEMFLDLKEAYHGFDGWAEFTREWSDAWSKIEVEARRIEKLSDQELAVYLHWDGVGRESGVAVSMDIVHLLSFRDGKLRRLATTSPEEADRLLAERG